MMSKGEIRRWRKLEKERLSCLIMEEARERCSIVIHTLDEVLRDK